jgi:threonine synthase
MNGIDRQFSVEQHAVLRYATPLLSEFLIHSDLQKICLKEGFRLLQMEPFDGVSLFLLDETTCMRTGTYKSLDGCVSIALSMNLGFSSVVFSSAANAGTALTEYGNQAGIDTFFFCPTTTLYKIRGELFENPKAHLICVEGSDRRVKQAAQSFSELTGIPLIPRLEWRILAAGVRGMFLAEQMRLRSGGFHWFAQAICAAFGPIGLYRVLLDLSRSGEIQANWIPSLLGIQQAALAPIASAWQKGQSLLSQVSLWNEESSIEPTLYNTLPSETYPLLRDILVAVGGDMITVERQEYEQYVGEYLKRLEGIGIHLTKDPQTSEFLEKAGLLAGTGVLKAIAEKRIRKGESVLCSLSGGTAPAPLKPANPEFRILLDANLETEVHRYATSISSGALGPSPI